MNASGPQRLAAALRRLARGVRQQLDPPPDLTRPQPATDWERAADERLSRIEQQLANQNRLLLFTLISILADVLFRVAQP